MFARKFRVNPQEQDIAPVEELIQLSAVVEVQDLIEQLLMPKLLSALERWVSSELANLNEVWVWYNGWKGFLQ